MAPPTELAQNERPNIVYIMADELGYYELTCMGHPNFKTPNVDRLAAEGVRYTQALAGSAVYAPTRACLMTGKHSGHTSVRTNGGGTPLRDGEETIASLLKRAGYPEGAIITMLKRMDEQLADAGGLGFAKTHPSAKSRVDDLDDAIGDTEMASDAAREQRFAAAMQPVVGG